MDGGAAYQPLVDAENCSESGAVLVESMSQQVGQCHPASPGKFYSFGFRFKGTGPGDLPQAFCLMIFYSDTTCSSFTTSIDVQPVSDKTTWVPGSGGANSPDGTGSVMVICSGQGGFGYYDQFYLSDTNGTF
jgi:hypothetical protein